MSEKVRTATRYVSYAAAALTMAAPLAFLALGAAPRVEASPDRLVLAAPPEPPEPPEPPGTRSERSRSRRPWLGVTLESDGDQVEIRGVAEGSPADEAGLKRGDVIVEINGRSVEDEMDVVNEILDMSPGDTVKIRVERDGSERTVTATLEGRAHRHGPRWWEFHTPDGDSGGDTEVFMFGPSRFFLGVEIHPMSGDLRSYFKAPRDTGLLVNRVIEDTPAEKAGMKAGDVILSVDGREISRAGDIARALREKEEGDAVPVKILRDGAERTLDVEVRERERPEYRRRSLLVPDSGGDIIIDRDVIVEIPEVGEEINRALQESMKALHESLRELPRIQEQINRDVHRDIRRHLDDEMHKLRDLRHLRLVNGPTYDI